MLIVHLVDSHIYTQFQLLFLLEGKGRYLADIFQYALVCLMVSGIVVCHLCIDGKLW